MNEESENRIESTNNGMWWRYNQKSIFPFVYEKWIFGSEQRTENRHTRTKMIGSYGEERWLRKLGRQHKTKIVSLQTNRQISLLKE